VQCLTTQSTPEEPRSLRPETSQDPDPPSVSVLGLGAQRRTLGREALHHGLLIQRLEGAGVGVEAHTLTRREDAGGVG
jgi:hypothetical protein